LHVHGNLLGEVSVAHRRRDEGDVADLGSLVVHHGIDVGCHVLPGPGHAVHLCLPSQLPFGADLARHAGHFGGKGIELVHHRVDGVLELENFSLHVHGDLPVQLATGDGGGHLGDVPDLGGEVAGHGVHVVGEILPDV